MGNTDKFRKISGDAGEMSRFAAAERLGQGKIEFDELGNAVWVPGATTTSPCDMMRLLEDPSLAISDDDAQDAMRPVKQNPQGVKKGYDPYDSGMLAKKQPRKKKDLRRLSSWIKSRKPKED